jgi:hypothetical protein
MRRIFLLIAITFLLQSCYSYKSVEVNPQTMAIGQVYKIERKNHKTAKVTFTRNADSAIVVWNNRVEEQIPLKDIKRAGERKFSWVKTALWYPITVITFLVLLIYTM